MHVTCCVVLYVLPTFRRNQLKNNSTTQLKIQILKTFSNNKNEFKQKQITFWTQFRFGERECVVFIIICRRFKRHYISSTQFVLNSILNLNSVFYIWRNIINYFKFVIDKILHDSFWETVSEYLTGIVLRSAIFLNSVKYLLQR